MNKNNHLFGLFVCLAILISACNSTTQTSSDLKLNNKSDSKFMGNPLYCEKDSDCTFQETNCNSCSCPHPVNIFNVKVLDCSNAPLARCNVVCQPFDVKCIDNVCTNLPK